MDWTTNEQPIKNLAQGFFQGEKNTDKGLNYLHKLKEQRKPKH
jgi:hypothetical protein